MKELLKSLKKIKKAHKKIEKIDIEQSILNREMWNEWKKEYCNEFVMYYSQLLINNFRIATQLHKVLEENDILQKRINLNEQRN